jgi:hypothetical protein
MSTKTDYSPEEWKAIVGAPVAAGLFISLADASGPVGLVKEAMAVGQAITQSAQSDAPEIVKALAEHVKSAGGRPEMPDVPRGDRAKTKAALMDAVKQAVGTVGSKSPGEVDAFKAWLKAVATKVSQASKEGGFLGFGGTVVSKDEELALGQLAEALGIRAASSGAA